MSSNGQPVRLVPSLDGTLFKFDGKSVDPLGFSADTLLKSSYKLGDDIIITGGKDAQSYGINLGTGKVQLHLFVRYLLKDVNLCPLTFAAKIFLLLARL